MQRVSRRALLKSVIAVSGLSVLSRNALSAILTPSAVEGPFYPDLSMRFDDIDNDLVKISGRVKDAGGEIIRLKGKVMSQAGKPLAAHRIEIWQCDVNGKYLHPNDRQNVTYDSGFQGFGHDVTDTEGNYSFRTIKPTSYPGRTPHIHVKVFDGKRELLTTQFYLADEVNNNTDSLYRQMSDKQAKQVSMLFTEHDNMLESTVDVIV